MRVAKSKWLVSQVRLGAGGSNNLWHSKHFKRFEYVFDRQLFNTHMGIYECLVLARLRLRLRSRHLAKKRVEPKRATPKNRHRNMAAAAAAAAHSKISQLFDDYWMARGGPTTPSTQLLPQLLVLLLLLLPPYNSRCPDSCFKCFVSVSLVFLAYEKRKSVEPATFLW